MTHLAAAPSLQPLHVHVGNIGLLGTGSESPKAFRVSSARSVRVQKLQRRESGGHRVALRRRWRPRSGGLSTPFALAKERRTSRAREMSSSATSPSAVSWTELLSFLHRNTTTTMSRCGRPPSKRLNTSSHCCSWRLGLRLLCGRVFVQIWNRLGFAAS